MKLNIKISLIIFIYTLTLFSFPGRYAVAQDEEMPEEKEMLIEQMQDQENLDPEEYIQNHAIFDDRLLLNGYTEKYSNLPYEIILEMIKDDHLSAFRSAAAIRVFKEVYAREVVYREKRQVIKILLRRLNRTSSPFVQVEIMHTICSMDRYRYFKHMAPRLIQKLNHYNSTVNEMAFNYIQDLIDTGQNRAREARVVFNTMRKILFLSRKRLENITEPGQNLSRKLKILRWSIKVLGTQELKKLPKEVKNLM
ncbi:MAG: hypothetical protein KC713_04765 [Candidatus Omnitrophica bacterium]|nr:hypothetical protein [Candidatus Omnitrophota bacterium]